MSTPQNPPQQHGHDELPKDLPKMSHAVMVLVGIGVIVCFAGLFLLGWLPNRAREREAHEQTAAANDAKPVVQTTPPKRTDKTIDLVLPADARANQETAIFPRANGYLKKLLVDIGDKVQKDQLLAEIDMPDVDADVNQAKASLAQAQANLTKAQNDFELADVTLKRYTGFAESGGVTQQQLDEKKAAFTQAQSALEGAKANVQVAQASLDRLISLQAYERVTAPFGGIISARNYDVGALMSASNTGDGKQLFSIADTETLRIFVNVPQAYVPSLKIGQPATLTLKTYPGRKFTGTIARWAGALDPATRTLRLEIDFPNHEGALFAGMYAEAHLPVNQDQPPLVVPTSALVFDSNGTRVWVVNDNKAYAAKVDVGRDFGTEVEISSGLKGNEMVVTNPGARMADGVDVQVAAPQVTQADAKPQQLASQKP